MRWIMLLALVGCTTIPANIRTDYWLGLASVCAYQDTRGTIDGKPFLQGPGMERCLCVSEYLAERFTEAEHQALSADMADSVDFDAHLWCQETRGTPWSSSHTSMNSTAPVVGFVL